MARGAASKEQVMAGILATFPGSFRYDKEIRIPMTEDGEVIQIKCVLTAAKTNVENGGDTAVPGATASVTPATVFKEATGTSPVNTPVEPSAEEKQAVAELISKLGL
jgi:hypothetical protein